MKFAALPLQLLSEPRWLEAGADSRAAWVNLALASCQGRTRGRFDGAKGWGEATWARHAAVSRAQVDAAVEDGLASWEEGSLILWGYDARAEDAHDRRVEAARRAGLASGNARRTTVERTLNARSTDAEPTLNADEPDLRLKTCTPPTPPSGGAPAEKKPEKKRRRAPAELAGDELVAFEAFWSSVPRKASKGHARATWATLRAEGRLPPGHELVSAARRWAEAMAREGRPPDKIQHPATWLNAEGWANEYGGPAPPAGRAAPSNDMQQRWREERAAILSELHELPEARQAQAMARLAELDRKLGIERSQGLYRRAT